MKDLFEGKEYEVITPKEGDIVRINVRRDYPLPTKRQYFLLVWPNDTDIYKASYFSKTINCYGINLGGHFSRHQFCYCPQTDKIVKPSIGDVFEFADELRINGYIYNRRNKKILKK